MDTTISKNELLLSAEFTDRLISLIDDAKFSIYIFMFDWRWVKNDFSCEVSRINQALVRAARRGVSVQALLNYADLEKQLAELNIQARMANFAKLMHAKSIVLDEEVIVLGSHNLTQSAMRSNVEMSLVVYDKELAARIINYFKTLWSS